MRRLGRFTRSFGVLFALWFAAVRGDPGVLHSCAMHGAAHGAGHGTAAASHLSHASHSAHGTHEHGAPEPTAPCTCVGHCCAAPIMAPVAAAPVLYVPVEVLAARGPLDATPAVPRAAPSLRLPFANGPPAV